MNEIDFEVFYHVPAAYSPSSKVVFALHGKGGKNTSWVSQLKSFTDNGEFVGIYPQGHLDSWNLGTEPSKADDVAFINLIIKELENHNNLDMNKIYAIGTSNGSGMVNKLGIHTSHFKAIAPVVSQLMESMPIKDNTKPLSIFQINGDSVWSRSQILRNTVPLGLDQDYIDLKICGPDKYGKNF